MLVDHTEHFSAAELRCRCGCDYTGMDADFMAVLEEVRRAYGKPMRVTSGYRCPDYNAKVSSTGRNGPHTQRKAVDIAVFGEDCWRLVEIAIAFDMTGIGLKQHGERAHRFLHLDRGVEGGPRPWVWTYS